MSLGLCRAMRSRCHLVSEVQGSFAVGALDEKGIWDFMSQVVFIQPLLNKLWWHDTLARAEKLVECSASLESVEEENSHAQPEKLDVLIAFMKEACTQQLVTQLT